MESQTEAGEVHDHQGRDKDRRFERFERYLDNPPACTLWPEARQDCPVCCKKVRFYCPDCMMFVGKPDAVDVPKMRLQLEVDVIVTPQERRRSSGIHVAVVAPQSVRVVPFGSGEDGLPAYDPGSALVVYPSKGSVCWHELPRQELDLVRKVILVDSRWETTGPVLNHPRLRGLRHVRISDPPARSRFWRWHISGSGHICTAEAIYFILKEFQDLRGVSTDGAPLEDLLFLFALMRSRIKEAYETEPSKAGKEDPSSEAAKRGRRVRNVCLDRLVKSKYKGISDLREREGEHAAIEEFCRRRRGDRSVYAEAPAKTVEDGSRGSSGAGLRSGTGSSIGTGGVHGSDALSDELPS